VVSGSHIFGRMDGLIGCRGSDTHPERRLSVVGRMLLGHLHGHGACRRAPSVTQTSATMPTMMATIAMMMITIETI
jgi:hypothetical protein